MTKRVGREFLVEVATLLRQPGSRREVVLDGLIEDLAISTSRVPEGAFLHLEVVLEAVFEGILVSGSIDSRWEGTCRRCLEVASGPLHADVRELYVAVPDEEETTYPLARGELDLSLLAHDACILELPLAPLCREDCSGLCPFCGANRNLEHCSCEPAPTGPFAALALLQANGDGEGRAGRKNRDD